MCVCVCVCVCVCACVHVCVCVYVRDLYQCRGPCQPTWKLDSVLRSGYSVYSVHSAYSGYGVPNTILRCSYEWWDYGKDLEHHLQQNEIKKRKLRGKRGKGLLRSNQTPDFMDMEYFQFSYLSPISPC